MSVPPNWEQLERGECEEGVMRESSRVTGEIVDACLAVHRALGPGLFERVYQAALKHELQLRGLTVEAEVEIRGTYRGLDLGCIYQCDLMVEDEVLLELKAQNRSSRFTSARR